MFQLIEKDSTNHHIEFKVYLSNHAAHLLIALHGLGCDPEEMEREYSHYVKSSPLEPVGQHWTETNRVEITDENWKEYLGWIASFDPLILKVIPNTVPLINSILPRLKIIAYISARKETSLGACI